MTTPEDRERIRRRFAENLLAARKAAGLSQTAVARRGGLHLTQVSLLERCRRLPRLDTLVKLGGALGIEPCELLAGMAWRPGRRRAGYYTREKPSERREES